MLKNGKYVFYLSLSKIKIKIKIIENRILLIVWVDGLILDKIIKQCIHGLWNQFGLFLNNYIIKVMFIVVLK